MSEHSSPILVRLTPPGRGAIATLLVEGPGARAAVQTRFRSPGGRALAALASDRLAFGHFGPQPGEEVVVRVRSERSVELHCHGGLAAVALIERALIEQGCHPLAWQEWAAMGSRSPIRAAAIALAEARTERTAAILLDQYQGALDRAVDEVLACLDRNDATGARQRLERLLERAPVGLHLVQPWRVVLAGPPNAGKSTLVNTLVGYARAIVDPQAGTTRDAVTALTAIEGWPVELCDTAGLRQASHPVERAGVEAARRYLAEADLVLAVFDLSQPWCATNQEILAAHPRALIVHTKSDLPASDDATRPAGHCVSAMNGEGIEELLRAIAARLAPHPPEPQAAVPFTPQQVDALSQALSAADPASARHALQAVLGATG